MSKCNSYNFHITDLFIPSIRDANIWCFSYDKTKMILLILFRFVLYMTLFKLLYNKEYTDIFLIIKILMLIIIVILMMVNMVSLGITLYNRQLYKKEIKSILMEKKVFVPRQWYNSLLEMKIESQCPAGTRKSG